MKELWRRSTAILWEHPIVWIPVLCADLLSFAAKVGNVALNRRLVLSLVRSHGSVLSQSPDLITRHVESASQAASWMAALDLATQFVTICLYTLAALITWSLVHMVVDEPKPEFGASIRSTGSRCWRIFDLVLRAFGFVLCFAILPTMLVGLVMPFLPLTREGRMPLLHAVHFGALLVAYVATAYWVTPRVLRLMRAEPETPIVRETLGDARLFAAIAAAVSLAISSICQMAERSLPALRSRDHAWTGVVTGAGASLLSALPYVVLFVFLPLAADEGPESLPGDGLVIDSPADASAP